MAADVIIETQLAKIFLFSQLPSWISFCRRLKQNPWQNLCIWMGEAKWLLLEGSCWTSTGGSALWSPPGEGAMAVPEAVWRGILMGKVSSFLLCMEQLVQGFCLGAEHVVSDGGMLLCMCEYQGIAPAPECETRHQSQGGLTALSNVISETLHVHPAPVETLLSRRSLIQIIFTNGSNNFQKHLHLQLSKIGDSPEKQMLVLPRAEKLLEKKESWIQANCTHRGFARERSKKFTVDVICCFKILSCVSS